MRRFAGVPGNRLKTTEKIDSMSATEKITSESGGVRIVFHWEKDRFHFAFEMADEATNGARLEAISSDEVETPVFAELHQQESLLFLSGMSDDRHWSMSVEPTDKGFALDVACRAKLPIQQLGTVYQTSSTDSFKITGEAIDKTLAPLVTQADSGACNVVAQGDFDNLPVTVRYRYRVERA